MVTLFICRNDLQTKHLTALEQQIICIDTPHEVWMNFTHLFNKIPSRVLKVGELGVNRHFLMSLRTRTPRHYIGFTLNRSSKDQLS